MKDWQERVVEEKKQLDERIDKLAKFIGLKGGQFDALDGVEKVRVAQQLAVMCNYSNILHERISFFTEE